MAKSVGDNPEQIPWANCRLLLASETEDDADVPQGIVGRLYFSPSSHPAVRQNFQTLVAVRDFSLAALAVQNIVNFRGPDALVGRIPGETRHSSRLLDLCKSCYAAKEVLTCRIPAADVVLVPRLPEAAERDGLYFIAYATNIPAVETCELLRVQKQVAVVLDIDNTLVDATPAAPDEFGNEQVWNSLDWVHTTISTSSGRRIAGQIAILPPSPKVETQDYAFLIHWQVGRISCTFKVRVRRGWLAFRTYLAQHTDRFKTYVCSKGKLEYIQLIWMALDPEGVLIPRDQWHRRINSTFPDTLVRAANKTALSALGCADITRPTPPTQVAAPVVFIDDCPDAYEQHYSDSILYVEEFRPSDAVHADKGSVLSQVADKLDAYWAATCGEAGSFAWQAAQTFSTAILGAMQRVPMESPDALAYLQVRCAKQGRVLWHQVKVASVLSNDVYIADAEHAASAEDKDRVMASMNAQRDQSTSYSVDNKITVIDVAVQPPPFVTTGPSSAGAAIPTDEVITASMMLHC